MKTLYKILFLFIFLCGISYSKEVRFIQITDINLTPQTSSNLYKTIKEINEFHDIDFVVFGGNNLKKANFECLNHFLYLLRKVNKKSYVLLGSNDVLSTSGLNKEYYMKRIRRTLFYRHSKKPNYVFKKNGYIFITMDGSKQYFQSSNGYYSKEELKWLEGNLKKYKNKNVIILQHFPIIETKSAWLETAKMEDYNNLLSKYNNVKVIVSGHYNENRELKRNEIYHILTENYSEHGAYKIIEIDLDEDFIGTYLVK